MKKFNYVLIVTLFCTSPSILFAEKMRIAVMDFKAQGVSASLAKNVTELVRTRMINDTDFIITERAEMDTILKEQGFQQSGCTDVNCAVQIGKILSANKILIGSVMKFSNKIVITGRIVDVEKGIGEFSQDQDSDSEEKLYQAVKLFTNKLAIRINKGKVNFMEEENPTETDNSKHNFIIKIGYDFFSKVDVDYRDIPESEKKDVSNDFSFNLDYVYNYKPYVGFGLGAILQSSRTYEIKNSTREINTLPLFLIFQFKLPSDRFSPYLSGLAGFHITKEDDSSQSSNKGIWGGIAIGMNIFKRIQVEILGARQEVKDYFYTEDTCYMWSGTYTRLIVSVGYIF